MKKLTIICVFLFALMGFFETELSIFSNSLSGVSAVMYDLDDCENYIINRYSIYGDLYYYYGDNEIVESSNYKQSDLNSYYNSQTGRNVTGTCTEAAVASYLYHYKYDVISNYDPTWNLNDIFYRTMNVAINKNLFTGTSTMRDDAIKVFNEVLSDYSTGKTATRKCATGYNIYKKVLQLAQNDDICIFNDDSHSMIACGIMYYVIQYGQGSNAISTFERFLIVNDGTSGSQQQYGYYPVSRINDLNNGIDNFSIMYI